MKNWIRFLLPAAIILGGVSVGQRVLQSEQSNTPTSGYLQTIKGISEPTIDGLLISDGKGSLTFNKQNGFWMLDGKKADLEKISNIISIILDEDGANYDLISQNPTRFDDFNVSSASAKISLKAGETEKLGVIVGNSRYPGNYIRPAKENNVYLTSQSLGVVSTEDRQSYYDKTVFSRPRDDLKSILMDNTKEKYTLIKTDGKWKMEDSGKEVDESQLSGLLANLESLKADKVIEDPAEKGNYKQTYGSLKVETNDGKWETLVAFKGKTSFMLERKSDGQLFTVSQTTVDNLLKPSKNLLK